MESILSVLPVCDEFVVMDDFSTDGTLDVLKKLKARYGKIRIIQERWPLKEQRDKALATATNWGLQACGGEWVVYCQADEVFHETITPYLNVFPRQHKIDTVTFHRMQLFQNFQIQHGDHWVVRMGRKDCLESADDALSFHLKGKNYTFDPSPERYQLFDITRCFVDHFPAKYAAQDEIWWHQAGRQGGWHGKDAAEWKALIAKWQQEGYPPEWTATTSPFKHQLPVSMVDWVGATTYYARPELL